MGKNNHWEETGSSFAPWGYLGRQHAERGLANICEYDNINIIIMIWFQKTRGGTSFITKCVTVLAVTISVMLGIWLRLTS